MKIPREIYDVIERGLKVASWNPDGTGIYEKGPDYEKYCSLLGQHNGFFITGAGGYYCDSYCQHMFTED